MSWVYEEEEARRMKKQMSYGTKENEEHNTFVVTIVGFGELEQIENEHSRVYEEQIEEKNKFLCVFEEIFEELEEIKELEEQESWVYARIQQLYEGFEQMNVETRVLNFQKKSICCGLRKTAAYK